MAFTLPTFNLVCDIFTGPWIGHGAARIANQPCNLALGRRGMTSDHYLLDGAFGHASHLLLPPLTDIRDYSQGVFADFVECPSGSGRFYFVESWDDMAKGFSNEYRLAILVKLCDALDPASYPGVFWPTPGP